MKNVAAMALGIGISLLLAGRSTAGAPPVRLESPTPGLRVRMEGPVTLSGNLPLRIDDLPAGTYRWRVEGPGTLIATGKASLDSGGRIEAERAAGPASLLLPPGLSFVESGRPSRGLLLLSLGTGTLAVVAAEEIQRRDARNDYTDALDSYHRAGSAEEALEFHLQTLAAADREEAHAEMRSLCEGYLGAVWLGSALEAWLLTPSPSVERTGEGTWQVQAPRRGGLSAGFRSALVPGSGQRALGHEGRGNRFLVAVGLLGAAGILAQDAYLDARRDQRDLQRRYDTAVSEDEIARLGSELQDASDRREDRDKLRWGAVALTVGVHLWNVIDAVGLGSAGPGTPPVGIQVATGRSGLRAGLVWRIS